jgi:flagella basal body P-ring formation protein FlgA
MKGWQACAALSVLLAAALLPGAAAAWEVCLHADVTTQAAIVRLGDVADIVGDDLPSGVALEQIVVALGPTRSHTRELTPSDVRKTLAQRGVDVRQCQLTGAARVVVTYGSEPTLTGQDQVRSDQESRSRLPGRTRDVSQQQAAGSVQRRLEEIVAKELQQLAGDSCPWKATVKLTEQVPDKLLQARSDVTVESLQEAREGTFQLVACVSDGRARARVPFEARAHKLIPVVVPVRPLVRGEMVRANDVELRYVDKTSESGAVVQRLADAVGHQTRQSVSADQPLSVRSLQQPLLVRKNEEVDVMVRCGAIQAHRRAVALDNGTRGDMITVETTDGSQTQFNARVVDIRQVEVLPNSTSAGQ